MNNGTKEIRMKSQPNSEKNHPFEDSGNGLAPFKVETYFVSDEPTSCDHCGTGIKNVFGIIASDGNRFKVGSSCVEKTDFGLFLEAKKIRSDFLKQLRKERKEAGIKAWKKEKAEKEQNNLSEFCLKYPEIFKFLEENKEKNDFYHSLFYSIKTWGKLTEKQEKAILKTMNPIISNYVGEVGQKKVSFKVTLEKRFSFDGRWGTSYIYSFLDESGNVIVYKGTYIFEKTRIEDGQFNPAQKGDAVEFIASIKSHTDYKGNKQTIVERPKQKL